MSNENELPEDAPVEVTPAEEAPAEDNAAS